MSNKGSKKVANLYWIDWSEEADIVEEILPADKLDRAKYAQFLTGFLAGQGYDETRVGNEKKNYVLNLNSEWGSGKTYFLKRWYQSLKPHYPVVYVDAWKQDYSDDPLMTVISSVIKQLRDQAGKPSDDPSFKVPRKAIGLLKAALPSMAGALSKRYLGIDPVAIMNAPDNDDVGSQVKDEQGNTIDMGAAASKMVQYLLDEHDAKSQAIESLKLNVEQWVQAVVGHDRKSYPAFILVDELDRCRPSYAVEMLETIKHIFDIPGVVFVVGTDTDQLQHAVKAIYGEGFDARTYLGRFFNSRCTLEEPSFANLLETHCDLSKLSPSYFKELQLTVYPRTLDGAEGEAAYRNLTKVYESFSLTSRQVIQVTNRLIAIVDNLSSSVVIDLIYLTCLLSIREKSSETYNNICRNPRLLGNSFGNNNTSDFLNQNTKYGSTRLEVYLEPQDMAAEFIVNQRTIKNVWVDGYYTCVLKDYIGAVSQYVLSSQNQNTTFVDKAIGQAYEFQSTSRLSMTKGEVWIAVDFGRLQGNGGQSFDFYKKLVDLSSALDSPELEE